VAVLSYAYNADMNKIKTLINTAIVPRAYI